MKNTDPLAPWHDPVFNLPDAPHVLDPDNPNKPWNKIFWSPQDLSAQEKRYYKLDFKLFLYGKKKI
jgi:hypothetical protein